MSDQSITFTGDDSGMFAKTLDKLTDFEVTIHLFNLKPIVDVRLGGCGPAVCRYIVQRGDESVAKVIPTAHIERVEVY
jgi:hypothetical protein